MSDSANIKTAGLCWLRFGRRYTHVCTEGGNFNADVLGATSKVLVEIETKISKADFKADFAKSKHDWYNKVGPLYRGAGWVPNQMYFAVPRELADWAVDYLEHFGDDELANARYKALAPTVKKYGVLAFDDGRRTDDALTCVKTAGKIHAVAPSSKVLDKILLRMGSELTGFHIYTHRYASWLSSMKAETAKLSGALDIDPECAILEGEVKDEPVSR